MNIFGAHLLLREIHEAVPITSSISPRILRRSEFVCRSVMAVIHEIHVLVVLNSLPLRVISWYDIFGTVRTMNNLLFLYFLA